MHKVAGEDGGRDALSQGISAPLLPPFLALEVEMEAHRCTPVPGKKWSTRPMPSTTKHEVGSSPISSVDGHALLQRTGERGDG